MISIQQSAEVNQRLDIYFIFLDLNQDNSFAMLNLNQFWSASCSPSGRETQEALDQNKSTTVRSTEKMVGIKPTDLPPTVAVKFFGAGMAACFADLITFPLDTAKVRLQVRTY